MFCLKLVNVECKKYRLLNLTMFDLCGNVNSHGDWNLHILRHNNEDVTAVSSATTRSWSCARHTESDNPIMDCMHDNTCNHCECTYMCFSHTA